MRKLNLKTILFQWFGIFFLINGILRFFYSVYAKEIVYLLTVKKETNGNKSLYIISDFLLHGTYIALGALLLGIIIITIRNWKNRIHFLNTIIVLILSSSLFPIGIIFSGFTSNYLNSFGWLFVNDYKYSFLIGGITFTIIGSFLIWKSKPTKEKHSS
jgi:hypothetical protein